MTLLYILDEDTPIRILDLPDHPDLIVRRVNQGDWQPYLGLEPSLRQAWQAMRVGKAVLIIPPPAPDSYPRFALKPRQVQILQAISAGLSQEETAFQLHLGLRAVRNQLKRLREVFHAGSNTQLVAYAVALGIVHPDLDALFDH